MTELLEKRIYTNDLKEGARVKLRNSWEAIMRDNKRGNYRYAEVFGAWQETGEIYAHDIVGVKIDEIWYPIQHTLKQKQMLIQVNDAKI